MKMFTAKEKKNLIYVLSKLADRKTALCLEELHGLLFGIAITPEPITPDEWLPVIFEGEAKFDDDQDTEVCVGHLLAACNRMINDSIKGKLVFPFNYNILTNAELSLIESWTCGLYLGLSLRPHIWRISKEYENIDSKEISAEIRNMMDCCGIITTIAVPEERAEIYEPIPGLPAKSPAEVEEMLYFMLPAAVEGLRQHGAKLRKENPDTKPPKKKISRTKP
jgi:yecA family protein